MTVVGGMERSGNVSVMCPEDLTHLACLLLGMLQSNSPFGEVGFQRCAQICVFTCYHTLRTEPPFCSSSNKVLPKHLLSTVAQLSQLSSQHILSTAQLITQDD